MKQVAITLLVLLLAPVSGATLAQQEAGAAKPWSFGIGLGGFDPDDGSGQLKNQSGQYSLFLDVAYRYSENVRFAFDMFADEQRFDTPATVIAPFLGTLDGRARVSGGGFNAVAKFGMPMGRFEPYVGAAVGLYFNSMIVTGSVLGLPARAEEDDSGIGEQLLAGVNVRVSGNWSLGFEFRRTFLKADFGPLTDGEVDIGGDSYLLTARFGM
jgi:opacity protein-like surface antigen